MSTYGRVECSKAKATFDISKCLWRQICENIPPNTILMLERHKLSNAKPPALPTLPFLDVVPAPFIIGVCKSPRQARFFDDDSYNFWASAMNLLTTRYTRDSVQTNRFRLQIYTILGEIIM